MTAQATPAFDVGDRVRLPAALPADAAEWGPEDLSLLTPLLGKPGRVVSTIDPDPDYTGWTPMAEVAVDGRPEAEAWFWPVAGLTRLPDPWAALDPTADPGFAALAREARLFVEVEPDGCARLHSLARRCLIAWNPRGLHCPGLPRLASGGDLEAAVAAFHGRAYTGAAPPDGELYAYLAAHPEAFARDRPGAEVADDAA